MKNKKLNKLVDDFLNNWEVLLSNNFKDWQVADFKAELEDLIVSAIKIKATEILEEDYFKELENKYYTAI